MGLFKSKEEKEAIAKEKAEKLAKFKEEERIRKEKQAKELNEKLERERIAKAKAEAKKKNENLWKGMSAEDIDPKFHTQYLIEQNNRMIELLTNIAIMNSNLLNNPILVAAQELIQKRTNKYHKDFKSNL